MSTAGAYKTFMLVDRCLQYARSPLDYLGMLVRAVFNKKKLPVNV